MLLAPALGHARSGRSPSVSGRSSESGGARSVDRVEGGGTGILNLFISADAWYLDARGRIVGAGERFGAGVAPEPEYVNVES